MTQFFLCIFFFQTAMKRSSVWVWLHLGHIINSLGMNYVPQTLCHFWLLYNNSINIQIFESTHLNKASLVNRE